MHVLDGDTVAGQHVVRQQDRQPAEGVDRDRLAAQVRHGGDRGTGRDDDLLHAGAACAGGGQRVQPDRPGGLSGQVGGPLALIHIDRSAGQVGDGVDAAGDGHDLHPEPGGGEVAPLLGDVQAGRADGRDHRHRQVRFLHSVAVTAGAGLAAAARCSSEDGGSESERDQGAADGTSCWWCRRVGCGRNGHTGGTFLGFGEAEAGRNFGEGSPAFALSVAGDTAGRAGDAIRGAGADGQARQQQGTVERVAVQGGRPGPPGQFPPQVGRVAADQAPGSGAVATAGGLEPVIRGAAVAGDGHVVAGQHGAQGRQLSQRAGRHGGRAGEHVPRSHGLSGSVVAVWSRSSANSTARSTGP